MAISPARKIAYQILRRAESGKAFAVDLLQEPATSRLRDPDRKLATELVMGALRWHGELDFQIERLSERPIESLDPEIATILRLGVYQVRFLEKVPPSAAVNEAVELTKAVRKRSAAGLVNAALRKSSRLSRRSDAKTIEAACRATPQWLLNRWEEHFGLESARSLAWASVQVPFATLRAAGDESAREQIQRRLARQGVRTRLGRFSNSALIVESGNVRATEPFRSGDVVIQDEASQLVATLLDVAPGQKTLDLCAAPGIKTGQLASTLSRGFLVACDSSARRLRTMARLQVQSWAPGVYCSLVRLDATRELPFGTTFDRILLDAPCSGTGTLCRNPEIKLRLGPDDLPRLAAIQTAALRNALKTLGTGGRLVYATCSMEPEENEEVVEKVLGEFSEFRRLATAELSSRFPELSPLFDSKGYFRTRPDRDSMDGFFAAVIVRDLP